jgi:organic radical activating enzyme
MKESTEQAGDDVATGKTEYSDFASEMRDKLNSVSPSFCLAKWLQVSLHLPQGRTQSCYHPPTHLVPLESLKKNPSALHNTPQKIEERKQMMNGERPAGCSYCWKMEDAPGGGEKGHMSDRHYRSSEWWASPVFDEVVENGAEWDVTPRYVEVNFNQACNFKCMYCSPHLSTTWHDEIKQHGSYKLAYPETYEHNNLDALKALNLMPLEVSQKENPYVKAFWEWWPTIYHNLRVFRMTGGEPLMDSNTFKILEYVRDNPHGKIELSITSNFCPPQQKLFDRFLNLVKELEVVKHFQDTANFNEVSGNYNYIQSSFKHFALFVSCDGYGEKAEYMRHGMDFSRLRSNVEQFLTETRCTSVTFINTFNVLSLSSLKEFLQMMLELRQKFSGKDYMVYPEEKDGIQHKPFMHKGFQRVWFDIPVLRYPNWFMIQNSGTWGIDIIKDCLEFMEQNVQDENYSTNFQGFKPYEILKLKRNLGIMEEGISAEELHQNKANFYRFIQQHDERRNVSFLKTFPEYKQFYNECKQEAEL